MGVSVELKEVESINCDCGRVHEISRDIIYEANITHNLNKMANEAGIYEAIWRPYQLREEYDDSWDHKEETKFAKLITTKAHELIPFLEKGYDDMKARPEHYKTFDDPNGWGLYIYFLPWVKRYLDACKENPNAIVDVWR